MKFYLFSFILESAVVRSEMEVVLRCKDYIQVDALTVVEFTVLYAVTLTRWLLLSSRVSSLVVINSFILSVELFIN